MAILGLLGFIVVMWIIILAACAFLIVFVAPIDNNLLGINNRIITSSIQASIAILLVVVLVMILDRFKKTYIRRKLKI